MHRMWSEGSVNFGIIRNYVECVEVCEVVQRVGNRVAEYGFKYFCLDYVSKIEVSVTERNIYPGPRCRGHAWTNLSQASRHGLEGGILL